MERSKAEEILNSLDGMSRAQARPYMYTRVMARLQEENSFWGRTTGFLTRPVMAIVCLSAVILANVFTVIKADYTQAEQQQEEVTAFINSTSVSDVLQNDNYILAVNDTNLY